MPNRYTTLIDSFKPTETDTEFNSCFNWKYFSELGIFIANNYASEPINDWFNVWTLFYCLLAEIDDKTFDEFMKEIGYFDKLPTIPKEFQS